MKPFLKWAGNKYRIIAQIQSLMPAFGGESRLIEPFVGSGAVFLNTGFASALLADTNPDLILLYQTLQQEGLDFIDYCKRFFVPENNGGQQFYAFRETFNTTADGRLKAALFLYLNRHGYNGLCRYNAKGQFNVPFGRYKAPYFPEKEMQAFYTKAAQAVFVQQDFLQTLSMVRSGDWVYCDPPYVPLSHTANFTGYSAGGFSMEEQLQLAAMAKQLSQRGAYVIISNHNTPLTQELYQEGQIKTLDVARFISCQGAGRQKVSEVLVLYTPPAVQGDPVFLRQSMLL